MSAGNPCIITLVGGTSTLVVGAPNIWAANLAATPFSVSISGDMNSTATTPNWAVFVTDDVPGGLITASSSSASALSITSTVTFPNSSVSWYSSFGATNSSNALISITTPFRYLTLATTAGTSSQILTATILQAG